MAKWAVSRETDNDLNQIAEFTIEHWGLRQAEIYLMRLEEGLELLASRPSIGRSAGLIRKELRRFEIGEHVAFYVPTQGGIFIVRVLHKSMMPGNYL